MQLAEYLLNLHPDLLEQMLLHSIQIPKSSSAIINESISNQQENGHAQQIHNDVKQYLVPIEASVTKECPFSLQILPRSDLLHKSSTGAPPPFIISATKSQPNWMHTTTLDQYSTERTSDQKSRMLQSMTDLSQKGFILLSVQREKYNYDSEPPGNMFRSSSLPSLMPHKILKLKMSESQKYSTDSNTHSMKNKISFENDMVSHKSSQASDMQTSSSTSRFRVTRIADKNSWWMPEKSTRALIVHDLKTSSLPEFVLKQVQESADIVKNISQDPNYCPTERFVKEFWRKLEPEYLNKW